MSADPVGAVIDPEVIYAEFKKYVDVGVLQYVVPTDPLGEEWVLGQAGVLVKLIGDDQAAAWLAGASAVARFLAERAGQRL